jgi:hypothetical protein
MPNCADVLALMPVNSNALHHAKHVYTLGVVCASCHNP